VVIKYNCKLSKKNRNTKNTATRVIKYGEKIATHATKSIGVKSEIKLHRWEIPNGKYPKQSREHNSQRHAVHANKNEN